MDIWPKQTQRTYGGPALKRVQTPAHDNGQQLLIETSVDGLYYCASFISAAAPVTNLSPMHVSCSISVMTSAISNFNL